MSDVGRSSPAVGASSGKHFRVIFNDDFDSHAEFNEEIFELWARTGITTYSLCIGADVANYPSTTRTTFAENLRKAQDAGRLEGEHARYWYEFLVAEEKDPLAMAVEYCRKRGIEVWASLRMNDIHHGEDPDAPSLSLLVSSFWRKHPEFRAKGWEHPPSSLNERYPEFHGRGWDSRAWASYSFEHPEVRQRCLDTVREVAELYDIDAFDLDYSRMPPFFDRGRGYECRDHMTALVRDAKHILDEVSAKKGKRILLAACVRSTITKNESVGLDVVRWIEEGLVDILMPCQDAGCGTDIPVEQFVEPAHAKGIQVCPSFDNVAWPGATANIYAGALPLRASVLRAYKGGADGVQLYNYFAINEIGHFETQLCYEGFWRELGDIKALEGKDAFYIFTQGLPVYLTGGIPQENLEAGLRGQYWIRLALDHRVPPPAPGRQETGQSSYRFYVAHDVEKARAEGWLRQQRLSFSIVHAGVEDDIRFRLNEEPVAPEAIDTIYRSTEPLPAYGFLPPYTHYEIDLSKVGDLRNGWNTLWIDAIRLTDAGAMNERFRGLDAAFYQPTLLLIFRGPNMY